MAGVAQLVGALSRGPEGHEFDSIPGHIAKIQNPSVICPLFHFPSNYLCIGEKFQGASSISLINIIEVFANKLISIWCPHGNMCQDLHVNSISILFTILGFYLYCITQCWGRNMTFSPLVFLLKCYYFVPLSWPLCLSRDSHISLWLLGNQWCYFGGFTTLVLSLAHEKLLHYNKGLLNIFYSLLETVTVSEMAITKPI